MSNTTIAITPPTKIMNDNLVFDIGNNHDVLMQMEHNIQKVEQFPMPRNNQKECQIFFLPSDILIQIEQIQKDELSFSI